MVKSNQNHDQCVRPFLVYAMVIFVVIIMSFNVAAGATRPAPFLLQQAWAQIQSSNDGAIGEADEGSNNNNNNSLTFKELFARAKDSVVQVTVSGTPLSFVNNSAFGIGSGFVFDSQSHIITNNHVIYGGSNVTVTFSNGTIYTAEVVGADMFSDIAVLKVVTKEEESAQGVSEGFIPLPLGNSSMLAIGDEVAAIGNPFGLTGSMTTGVVSGLGRLIPIQTTNITTTPEARAFSIPNIIQTDAAINPGNSGGPLLNMNGEVVGLNTAVLSSGQFFSGIGFSIPSDTLRIIVPALIANGTYLHPWVGVAGTDITPEIALALGLEEARGLLVVDITPGSPADKSGIRGGDMPVTNITGIEELRLGGDIIMNVDDQRVNKTDDLLSYIETNKQVGDTVTMTILRDGSLMEIGLVLGSRPIG
ncbi:MAG: trypsin-like peptidase domain-containing protein [Thermoproteota archaeon]|nr:trypsin-like peptidase domain-containing protein [Thermoproteota archaeon]